MPDDFSDLLLSWYDAHARTLPWRGIHNAYHTWVSETMLQQTRVETVLSYYERFLSRFPTVEALAAAREDEVLKLWEGLGYYRRAANLHKGARQVAAEYGGELPQDVDALKKISGIGEYTAGANGQHLGHLGLFLRGAGKDQAGLGGFLCFHILDDNAVTQRLHGHDCISS